MHDVNANLKKTIKTKKEQARWQGGARQVIDFQLHLRSRVWKHFDSCKTEDFLDNSFSDNFPPTYWDMGWLKTKPQIILASIVLPFALKMRREAAQNSIHLHKHQVVFFFFFKHCIVFWGCLYIEYCIYIEYLFQSKWILGQKSECINFNSLNRVTLYETNILELNQTNGKWYISNYCKTASLHSSWCSREQSVSRHSRQDYRNFSRKINIFLKVEVWHDQLIA